MNTVYKFTLLFFVLITLLNAQSTRGLVNDGVDEYENNNFAESEVNFKKGIDTDLENFESRFNLGDAIYKQGRYEEALEEFKNSMPLALTNDSKSSIYHNIGNTLLKSKKLEESIAAYREALKLTPNDMETKYNLSYALKQMQNQQNDQNQDNQDKNDQNDQNKEQQDQDKNEDKQDEEQQDQQQQNQDQNKEQQQQPQEPKDEISKDEAQRILDALKNNEAELQKKMREHKTKKTNVEKDW